MNVLPQVKASSAEHALLRQAIQAPKRSTIRSAQPKDMQANRLYTAERESVRGKGKNFAYGDVKAVQEYVDRLTHSEWFGRRWGGMSIRVEHSHRARWARGGRWAIYLPGGRWAWTEDVILHELAHSVIGNTIGLSRVQGHGREFAAIFVDLVQHKMGKAHADALKASFRKHKVKFTKPRPKRVLTPEQKAALVERLAAARAAKVVKAA